MVLYHEYNPNSTVRVEETLTIKGAKAFLRHIPKQASIVIDGFAEVDSLLPQVNQFSCQYSLDSIYRDANRVLNFNAANNGQSITVSYIAVGTVFTADDANEIKAHLENSSIHGGGYELPTASASVKGGVVIGTGLSMDGEVLNCTVEGGGSELPIASSERLGGIKIGQDLQVFADGKVDVVHHSHFNRFDVLFSNASYSDESWSLNTVDDYGQYYSQIFEGAAGRLPTFGDIVHWRNSYGYAGYAIYIKRGATGEFLNLTRDTNDAEWRRMNPILSVADRAKLDTLPYELPTASASVKGGVVIGTGLEIDGDTLNASAAYELPTASASVKGGVKVGNSLVMTNDTLNVALGATPLTLEGSMWIHVP